MGRTKLFAGVLAAAVFLSLIAPQLFREFSAVRIKVVETAVPAASARVEVPIPPEQALNYLQTPFALIARVRNDGTSPLEVRVALDDAAPCSAAIEAGGTGRIDCPVPGAWIASASHKATFSANSSQYTVESLELATHFGAITAGPRNLIIVANGFKGFRGSSINRMAVIALLLVLSAGSLRDRRLPTVLSAVHLGVVAIVTALMAAVTASRFFTQYSLLLNDVFLIRLLVVTALPLLVAGGSRAAAVLTRPRILPWSRLIGAGLVVGAVFLSFASYRISEMYGGNPSGLLVISKRLFDRNPMLRERDDIRYNLHLDPHAGYDAQFFYFMAFDPFITTFRNETREYRAFVDAPPYRYGRIGFVWLTKMFSGNQQLRYPITMIALVLSALVLCGSLLAAIARHYGWSPWYGALIILVPGFWQSVEVTLPEPLAIAFLLAGYLCLLRKQWWACGVCLGASMLIRESGGALVLALPIGLFFAGKRRESIIIALLAFVPVVVWKVFVGWVFFDEFGMEAVAPHPDNGGPPFGGIWHMWAAIQQGEYVNGTWELARAGVFYAFLTTAASALAVMAVVTRPSPTAFGALAYALMTITFNYRGIWIHPANAQRVTIDLFVILALLFLQTPRDRPLARRAFTVFWGLSALYVFVGTFEASFIQRSMFHWFWPF
jgi:hypothetical protein